MSSCRRWVLAKYEVDTFKDVYTMEDAIKKFPEVKEYDHDFDPKQHKQELEVSQLISILNNNIYYTHMHFLALG